MRQLLMAALFLPMVGMVSADASSSASKWVKLGFGCLEVPSAYRVVWTDGRVDYFGGYIEPPEKNWKMTWFAGLWESFLEPTDRRRVLWKKGDSVDGRQVTIGLYEEAGKSSLVISDGLLQLALPAQTPNAESLLEAMLRRYDLDCRALRVSRPPD